MARAMCEKDTKYFRARGGGRDACVRASRDDDWRRLAKRAGRWFEPERSVGHYADTARGVFHAIWRDDAARTRTAMR